MASHVAGSTSHPQAVELPEPVEPSEPELFFHSHPHSVLSAEDFLVALFGSTYTTPNPIPANIFYMIQSWWSFSAEIRHRRRKTRQTILKLCLSAADLAEMEAEKENMDDVDIYSLTWVQTRLDKLEEDEGWLNDLYLASRYHLWRWTGHAVKLSGLENELG